MTLSVAGFLLAGQTLLAQDCTDCEDPACRETEACACRSGQASVIFQAAPVRAADDCPRVPELFAGETAELLVAPGSVTRVYSAVVSQLGEGANAGIQGLVLSLGVEGDGALVGASLDDTVFAPGTFVGPPEVPHPLTLCGEEIGGSYSISELFPGGVVFAAVLAFMSPATLPPSGTATVLALDIETAERGKVEVNCAELTDGQLVFETIFTAAGASEAPCTCYPLTMYVEEPFPEPLFLGGDPNDDSRVDIADAIWILGELFRGTRLAPCRPAADADGNGAVQLTDAIFILRYRFGGGRSVPPPPPFPDCGTDFQSGLDCPPGSMRSCR